MNNKIKEYYTSNTLPDQSISENEDIKHYTEIIYLYSKLSDYYQKINDYSKSFDSIKTAYFISLNNLGTHNLVTGKITRKLGLTYLYNNDNDNAIRYLEKAYANFYENDLCISYITTSTFKQLCTLYITSGLHDKLHELIQEREETLIKYNGRLYEIVEVLIQIGEPEEAYLVAIDEFDFIYTQYGNNHNFTALANLFNKMGDRDNALKCLKLTQRFFINTYKKRSVKIDRMIERLKNPDYVKQILYKN